MTAGIVSESTISGSEAFEQKLATMTRSLYEAALDRGIDGSTIAFQLSLWTSLREEMGEDLEFASA